MDEFRFFVYGWGYHRFDTCLDGNLSCGRRSRLAIVRVCLFRRCVCRIRNLQLFSGWMLFDGVGHILLFACDYLYPGLSWSWGIVVWDSIGKDCEKRVAYPIGGLWNGLNGVVLSLIVEMFLTKEREITHCWFQSDPNVRNNPGINPNSFVYIPSLRFPWNCSWNHSWGKQSRSMGSWSFSRFLERKCPYSCKR